MQVYIYVTSFFPVSYLTAMAIPSTSILSSSNPISPSPDRPSSRLDRSSTSFPVARGVVRLMTAGRGPGGIVSTGAPEMVVGSLSGLRSAVATPSDQSPAHHTTPDARKGC